jgi:hypothetical protein
MLYPSVTPRGKTNEVSTTDGTQLGQSSYDPRVSRPALESQLDEHEHQALDLLDALPLGGEADSDTIAAMDVVRGLLPRLVESVAQTLIDAAYQLSQTEDRGALEAGRLDEIRLTLVERPRLSLAIAPAVETTSVLLGLDRGATASAVLKELAEQAEFDEALHACSTAIAERLAAAQPTEGGQPVARALWVFRCAAVAQAGPSIRARQLAAESPEHLALARALIEQHRDAAELVDAFERAVSALRVAKPEPPPTGPPSIDGPKRKFTYVHVILALIVLGLTLWHYVWR